jgi:archaeosine-15-forming tRNA-guanine transglycosylase
MENNNGATFVTFTAKTSPRMRKTNNPFNGVQKISRINGMLNFHYDNAVLRRLEKEGKSAEDFTKGESWHMPVMNDGKLTPLCVKKTDPNAFYLRFMLLNILSTDYVMPDGRVIASSDLDPFMQKSDYSNQGLDKPVLFLTYSLDSIEEITIGGETYKVE